MEGGRKANTAPPIADQLALFGKAAPKDDISAMAGWAGSAKWLRDGDPHNEGMAIDADFGFFQNEDRFGRPKCIAQEPVLILEVEWKGEGDSLAAVTRDFYRALGEFVEDMTFVSKKVEARAIVFEVLTGSKSHGHPILVRLQGPRIEDVLAKHEANRADWAKRGWRMPE